MASCPTCGADNGPSSAYCFRCGKSLGIQPESVPTHDPSPIAQGIEALLHGQHNIPLAEQAIQRATQVLTAGEVLLLVAVQQKPLVNITPEQLILTNRRVIVYRPKLLGGMDFEDHLWRNLLDAKLKEGMIYATIFLRTLTGQEVSVDYLPKDQARRVYALAQEHEEKAIEERRRRDLEDKRAAAGGITMQNPSPSPTGGEDPVARLQQLKEMSEAGLITPAEYELKKAEILKRM